MMLRSRPSRDDSLADGDDVILRGNFAFYAAVEILCSKKMHGLLSRDGGFDQAFGVVGRGWANDFQSGLWTNPISGFCE